MTALKNEGVVTCSRVRSGWTGLPEKQIKDKDMKKATMRIRHNLLELLS
jgi:hypothetical protein